MSEPVSLRILIVEDSANDAVLVVRHIERAGYNVHWERVETSAELTAALGRETWDAILADYSMPEFSGAEALAMVRAGGHDVPFIYVSGALGEDAAVEAMRTGAHDYIVKGRLYRLVPAIERELRDAEVRRQRRLAIQALRESESRFVTLIETAPDVIFSIDSDGLLTLLNPAFEKISGWPVVEWLGRHFLPLIHPDDAPQAMELFERLLQGETLPAYELRVRTKEGSYLVGEFSTVPVIEFGRVVAGFGIMRNITKRKRAKEQIERLSRFPSENPSPVIRISVDGILEYANVASEGFLRVMEAEVGGAVNAEWRARIDHAITKKHPDEFEVDAGGLIFSVTLVPVVNHGYVNIYALDITERRQFEQSLQESEERFRLLSKATNDAIWDWNLDTDLVWWNEGYQTLFGYPLKGMEPVGVSWMERIHPEDRDRVLAGLNNSMATGAHHWSGEYRFARKDGSYAYVLDRGYVIRDKRGKPVRMIGGMTDLSERKRAEERMTEQAALLDAAHEAIYVLDLEDQIRYWNKGSERMYGWSAAEAIGRKYTDLVVCDSELDRCCEAKIAVLSSGEWHGEMAKKGRDGTEIFLELHWSLIQSDRGEKKSILVIGSDITGRKRLEAQFLRAQRMESIGTLAGGIAHDLNNLLAPILMSVDLLRLDERSEQSSKWISTIETSARRATELIKQVLSFARGVEDHKVAVNLRHIASDIQKLIQETFPKSIDFKIERVPDLWTVEGDPTQLHQVLMNLCVNARDAMPCGGKLWLKLKNRVLDELYAGMNPGAKPGSYVTIEVEDTGIGMPREIRDRVFDPFFTTKEPGKGTGLGLSTALAIVKSHKGFINLYSEPGKGTRFKVYLPASFRAEEAQHEVPKMSGLPRGSGQLILVVDDEENIRTAIQQVLELFGYRVILAANGAEAVASYAQRRADIAIVLTDMAMPVMDGAATITALKSMDPAVKIIGSSGYTSDSDLAKAAAAGVEHFVAKPCTAEALLRTLDAVLR